MDLLISPLARVLDRRDQCWADDVLSAVTGAGEAPVAAWVGHQPGASTGVLVSVWPNEAAARAAAVRTLTTLDGVLLEAGTVRHLARVCLGPEPDERPDAVQLSVFGGLHDAAPPVADELIDRPVGTTVADLAGCPGALVGATADGSCVVLMFLPAGATVPVMPDRIRPSEPPGERSALSRRPDSIQLFDLVRSAPLAQLAIAPRV